MNRNRYAPMDLDDNSSFEGWKTPSVTPSTSVNAPNASGSLPSSTSTTSTKGSAPKGQAALRTSSKQNAASSPSLEKTGLRKRKTMDLTEDEDAQNSVGTRELTSANDASTAAAKTKNEGGFLSSWWPKPSETPSQSSNPTNTNTQQTHHTFSNHLLWPYILMGYLRLAFTLFTMALSIYLIVQFIRTVQHDLEMKAVEYSSEIIQQVHDCSKMYLANKCSPPEHRVPAMQQMCSEWELCMNRNPLEVGRLKVGAEAIAEVLNRLFEPLSIKTMIFGSVLFFGTMYLYFTAPSFENLKTLPPQLHSFPQQSQHQGQHSAFHQPHQSHAQPSPYTSHAGSAMANLPGMPQFGVPAGAAQMHHHYYGVGAIHGAHVVDRGLRRQTGKPGNGLSGMSLDDDDEDI
ncbi:hypothetical protein BCR33DRAFT_133214 [Rhizoclosmatium globosum]|uniref:Brl1/Brr6 domain-containing protein n=1 Tax=Rhizoclosmatium globosum TaxID=329046 RepID=A0A1Y2ALM3_9FUNG|nr:hypothetical protein BCR33DRAFT_133214 [Rhizoclosmatium globosum]|eukprot:ORY23479.1 hypothetical protein BCR33DRAFT_133214 [Rhizoclosmatium globosum]